MACGANYGRLLMSEGQKRQKGERSKRCQDSFLGFERKISIEDIHLDDRIQTEQNKGVRSHCCITPGMVATVHAKTQTSRRSELYLSSAESWKCEVRDLQQARRLQRLRAHCRTRA